MIEKQILTITKPLHFLSQVLIKLKLAILINVEFLRAIEAELMAKGYTKSENPDMLVSIFTKSNQRVDIYNNAWGAGAWGWGGYRWGWVAWLGLDGNQVSTKTEGCSLYDLIDANKKELIWQGSGTGYLVTRNVEKKEARIKEFVSKTMDNFLQKKIKISY